MPRPKVTKDGKRGAPSSRDWFLKVASLVRLNWRVPCAKRVPPMTPQPIVPHMDFEALLTQGWFGTARGTHVSRSETRINQQLQ